MEYFLNYPIPLNEFARNIATKSVTPNNGTHDGILHEVSELVRGAFDTPTSFVTMIGSDTQHFLAHPGTDASSAPKSASICVNTLTEKQPLVIPDMHADPRWRDHPLAAGEAPVRFYAGAPIVLSSGFAIGSICTIDMVPRPEPSAKQMDLLTSLTRLVAQIFELQIDTSDDRTAQHESARQTAQEEFLSLVGHELRTPLNAIVGLSEILETISVNDAEIVSALAHSAEHLSEIIRNILMFTELRSGEMTLDESRFSVGDLVNAAVADFGPLARKHGKSIAWTPDSSNPSIQADQVKLRLALANLLSNALLHGGRSVAVDIGLNSERHIVINVRDDGPGIEPGRLEEAFRPFGVGKKIFTRDADGMGLGLPLTQRLVELHGGMLQLSNTEGDFVARILLPSWRVT